MSKNLKALIEKRNDKVAEMKAITDKAAEEVRAIDETENEVFKLLETEVRALDETIERIEAQNAIEMRDVEEVAQEERTASTEEIEVRAFASYIREGEGATGSSDPVAVNLTKADNGAIIPKTIANKIIKTIYEIAPILEKCTHYTVKGTLSLPYYDETSGAVTVEYCSEFTDATSNVGAFKTIDLTGYLARSLSLVSKSLMNNSDIELTNFVVADMAEKIARFLEHEILLGTTNVQCLKNGAAVTRGKTTAASTAITLDDLIEVQDAITSNYQANAIWVMAPSTLTTLRKMKDTNGHPLLNQDITAAFGYVLFGKPVYVSDNMPEVAAGKTVIYYGDFSAIAVKFNENPNIEILREKYAEQHALGVLGFLEVDAKLTDTQAIAKVAMKA